MKRKYIGRWVEYEVSNGTIYRAKILSIEFHQLLKKPIFNLISPYGNHLRLTRNEILRFL